MPSNPALPHDGSEGRRPLTAGVRLGVAGLGAMGCVHAENVARLPGVTLARVIDSQEEVARIVAARLDVPYSTSLDEALADDLDGVVIATPTPLHADMIGRAAQAGTHILCEKPLALELRPSLEAVRAADDAGVILQVGFHRRHDPDFLKTRERIVAGELGDVYLLRVSARDMWTPPAMDYLHTLGNLFVDATIHDLDLARWMVGEIDEIAAIGASLSDPAFGEKGDVDNAIITIRFSTGALGIIDNSRVAGYGFECSAEIMGSRATVRIGASHRRDNVQWLAGGAATSEMVADHVQRHPLAYERELEHFVGAIRDQLQPAADGRDALAAFMLAEAAARSCRAGRVVRLKPHARTPAPDRDQAPATSHGPA